MSPAGGTGRELRVLVGSPAAGLLPDASAPVPDGTILLDLGEDHPSRAGLLELRVWTDGATDPTAERVVRAEVRIGALHRGAEKLFEVRDYRQVIMLADRHDWHAPFAGELAVALLCEQQLGLEVPARATWARTLLAEHTRVASHLGFLGWLTDRLDPGLAVEVRGLRERLRVGLAGLTGNRVHPMVTQVGGLAVDPDPGWLRAETARLDGVPALAARLLDRLDTDAAITLLDGEGPAGSSAPSDGPTAALGPDLVAAFGVSGPAARAAGCVADLRIEAPYLAYAELADVLSTFPAAALPGPPGGAGRRFAVLAAELAVSAALVTACAERLSGLPGPVRVDAGKNLRLPDGDGYLCTEAPLGRSGVYLVSRGERTPWRLKLRTASFNNVAAWEAVLPGCRVVDLEAALASLGYVVGDLDK
ncbi:NADH-quinone oxidoreductase subunit D [Friedmanniella endophytica]|uniref:NADH-quinone oxidoreductase subunit D n=1 Tax=Microlunatus kandeliicorticis TaxID=1759536 RepID=A0A7W3IP99_9ACTN|nr:NADH-quinone oxidoreductase subunit D [Microlunatus kandeliicorticis]MBA8792727.1 NADH-quinone oxidoreductase subunit D [Microlunatus kandeliicorticis]